MVNEMVLRSVYVRQSEDAQLRQMAHDLNVTKSDLIRAAIAVKLRDWLDSGDDQMILNDVEHGKRNEAAVRSGRARVTATRPDASNDTPDRSQGKDGPAVKTGKEKTHAKRLASADA